MESDLKESVHPLLNFVVLKAIMSLDKSPMTTLRNRLVNKAWLVACTGNWLRVKKHPVLRYSDVKDGVSGHQLGARRSDLPQMALAKFHALFEAGDPAVLQMVQQVPQKLVLHVWEDYMEAERGCADLNLHRWFRSRLATGQLLELSLVNTEFTQEVWVFKKWFLKTLPNLGKLVVQDCVVHQNALKDVNHAHQSWMECEDRGNWIRRMRALAEEHRFNRDLHLPINADVPSNLAYFEGGYQHNKLLILDTTLKIKVDDAPCKSGTQPALRIWGPLLAMLPKLKSLRVGGNIEDLKEPPPLLKPPGWDHDTNVRWLQVQQEWPELVEWGRDLRTTWIGEEPGSPHVTVPPSHLGNFWELIWDEAIGQVEFSLESLDLLDFSAKAQEYGVFSTWEIAAEEKNGVAAARAYAFPRMRSLALDMGMDPLMAKRDKLVIDTWIPSLQRLTLYRAPFAEVRFDSKSFRCWFIVPSTLLTIHDLELWGNIDSNLWFLSSMTNLRRFSWNTSCYEAKYFGKRVHHLLREGRKAYPLFTEDLVSKTSSYCFPFFSRSIHDFEIDFVMSLESWKQVLEALPGLQRLKGIFQDDKQLEELTKHGLALQHLHLAHGSQPSARRLADVLPKLEYLKTFQWNECACTRKLFQVEENGPLLREVESQLKSRYPSFEILELPWNLDDVDMTTDSKKICLQFEFENAIITGNSTRFFHCLDALGHAKI